MIINLTQHKSTPDQGVQDIVITGECVASSFGLRPDVYGYYPTLADLLTFSTADLKPANGGTIQGAMFNRAILLAAIAVRIGATHAMIGGAGYFLPMLERCLLQRDITPLHAFSERISVEETLPDGSVKKSNVFKHVGFIESGVDYAGDRDYGNGQEQN